MKGAVACVVKKVKEHKSRDKRGNQGSGMAIAHSARNATEKSLSASR